jgi:hypothetical protein
LLEKISAIFDNPYIKAGLLTGGLILTKVLAFYVYKEMRKEGIAIDI